MQPPSAAKSAKARARVEKALMRARGDSQGTCLSHPRGPSNKQEDTRVQQISIGSNSGEEYLPRAWLTSFYTRSRQ